ncbi:hypothetical protein KR084_006403 [Drosophila pseudotakahashii]|nr:hypothetical protein KR084_006403 [Drosophila pseudotakahashii]
MNADEALVKLIDHIVKDRVQSSIAVQIGAVEEKNSKLQTKLEVLQTSLEESVTKNSDLETKINMLQAFVEESVKKNSDLQTKLDVLQTSLEKCVQKNESEALNIRLGRLEDQQDDVQRTLERQLEVQNNLEKKQTSLLETWDNVNPKNLGAKLVKMEDPQKTVQTTLESQQVESQEALFRNSTMSSDLVHVGTRYFYVEKNITADWTTANSICQKMGGYLAAFQNQTELNAVGENLPGGMYWLGINDRVNEGEWLSVASGKPVNFFIWYDKQPDDFQKNEDCVHLHGKGVLQMNDLGCDTKHNFICQFDNEV